MLRILPTLLLAFFCATMSYTSHASQFTQEQQLTQKMAGEIKTFWQTGIFDNFPGVNKVRIEYAAFIQNPDAQCLVISPGRSEGYLKYQELAYDLAMQGVNVFIIDHRGQGISQRMQNNPHKGYVEQFDHYADDLYSLVNTIVPQYCQTKTPPLLLAHSMGSAIAIRLMQKHPASIKSALLSSPMIAINSGGLPLWLAKLVINGGSFINGLFGDQAWYFLGQSDHQTTPFTDNRLMHSKVRYQLFTDLYRQQPKLQLGGVTYNWLQQALTANNAIFAELAQLKTPVTILQAGNDSIVDNQAQNKFCQQLNQINNQLCSGPIVIDNAYHELFFEQDSYRNQALQHVVNWLNNNKD